MIQLMYRLLSTALNCLTRLATLEVRVKALQEGQIKIERTLGEISGELHILNKAFAKLLAAVTPFPAVGFVFNVELEGQIEEGATHTTMTNSQQATATIQPIDAKGNPASVDGVPVWATSDETIITVTPAADGLSAVVAAVGPLGTAKVSVTGDADLGVGEKPIFGTLDVTVTQGLAVGFKLTLGEPTEQGTGPVEEPPVA